MFRAAVAAVKLVNKLGSDDASLSTSGAGSPTEKRTRSATKTAASRVCRGDKPGECVVRHPNDTLVRIDRRSLHDTAVPDEIERALARERARVPGSGCRFGFLSLRLPRATVKVGTSSSDCVREKTQDRDLSH